MQGQTDLVRELEGATSGAWFFQAWTFVPGPFQQPPDEDPLSGSHLRLFNSYEDGGDKSYTVDVQFDARDQQLKVYVGNGLDAVNVPYLVDQWVPIDVVVDLDNDVCEVFYDQQPLAQFSWTAGWDGQGGGEPQIAAIDLFARGSSSIFYDDIVLAPLDPPEPPCPEDIDGNGTVGFGDLLEVLSKWGSCACCPEDLDGDGNVGFGDLLAVLSNWGPCGG